MVEWHHRLDGHEFEQALRVGDGQESLACCSPWSHKELDMTQRLNWTKIMSSSLRPHGLQHARLPCPSLSPRAYSNSCPLSQWCYLTISSSAALFFCLQSFPASGSFPVSQFFPSGGQRIGARASVLPMTIQDWFPLGWTGLISLHSKGLSRVFSSTTIWSINSLALSLLYGPALTSIHDHWKNHSFDYMDLCWQSDVFAF